MVYVCVCVHILQKEGGKAREGVQYMKNIMHPEVFGEASSDGG